LKALRAAVIDYEPGSARITLSETPATEIRELEASFTAFADRLAERERDLEVALADQVKLTREVHHRVKNNLQVIASLISLHARGETTAGAQLAYAAIQRRVDALAIVHRNHYAELEKSTGIDAKALIGELVANFQSNAGQSSTAPVVTITSIAAMVAQDTAMPLAFLFTEVTEIALFSNSATPISIHVQAANSPTMARLEISSASLQHRDVAKHEVSLRIVEALGRQLRSTVEYDVDHGRYSVFFPVLSGTSGR
jgi:two-component sensor histidine kinase